MLNKYYLIDFFKFFLQPNTYRQRREREIDSNTKV